VSLLSLVQEATDIIQGIPRPAAIVGSQQQDHRQLLALANKEGRELGRRTTWQALTGEHSFIAVANEEQPSGLLDQAAFIINETLYNRTRQRRVVGPVDAVDWQMQKATTTTLVDEQFRIRGSMLLLMPVPQAGDEYAYEYVTKRFVTNAGDTLQRESFAADTDVALIDEWLITLGVVWRWKNAKGLDYGEDFRTYDKEVTEAIARDGARRTLNFGYGRAPPGPYLVLPFGGVGQ
jgi:hypothetical protein